MKNTFRILNIIALIFWPIGLILNFVGLGIVPGVIEHAIWILVMLRRFPDLVKMARNPKILLVFAASLIADSIFEIVPWDFLANLFIKRIYNKQLKEEQTEMQKKAAQEQDHTPLLKIQREASKPEYKRAA